MICPKFFNGEALANGKSGAYATVIGPNGSVGFHGNDFFRRALGGEREAGVWMGRTVMRFL